MSSLFSITCSGPLYPGWLLGGSGRVMVGALEQPERERAPLSWLISKGPQVKFQLPWQSWYPVSPCVNTDLRFCR